MGKTKVDIDFDDLWALGQGVASGKVSTEKALNFISGKPFEELQQQADTISQIPVGNQGPPIDYKENARQADADRRAQDAITYDPEKIYKSGTLSDMFASWGPGGSGGVPGGREIQQLPPEQRLQDAIDRQNQPAQVRPKGPAGLPPEQAAPPADGGTGIRAVPREEKVKLQQLTPEQMLQRQRTPTLASYFGNKPRASWVK